MLKISTHTWLHCPSWISQVAYFQISIISACLTSPPYGSHSWGWLLWDMKLLIRQVKSLSEGPTIHFYCNPHSPLSLLTKVIQYYSYPVLSSLWIYPTLSCPRTFAPAISSPLCLASFFSSYRSQVEFHILQEASSDYPSLCRSPLVTLHLSSCFFRVAITVFTNLFICWFWFWF